MKTIFMGTVMNWDSKEDAERYFSALLDEADGTIPDPTDRIYNVLDNIRAGKDPAVDFE